MAQLFELSEQLQARVRNELRPGEQLSWVGQPSPKRLVLLSFGLWLFFVPWTLFTLFWIAGASRFQIPTFEDNWSFFPLFGLPFLLVGIGGLSAPLWSYRKARYTVYVLTNLRAITLEGASSVTVRSINAAQLGNIERTERADGSGDLILTVDTSYHASNDRLNTARGFFGIPDVKQVALLLESLAAKGRMV